MSTITSASPSVETHTLAFDDGPTFEYEVDDNGDAVIRINISGCMAVIDLSAWESVVAFVQQAGEPA